MGEEAKSQVEVYRSSRPGCRRYGLVLDAVGIPYEIQGEAGSFKIVVPATVAPRAREQIEAYAEENRAVPQTRVSAPWGGTGWAGVFGYAAVLACGFVLQETSALSSAWFEGGKTHAASIRDGELWRAFTALTLHSDLVHLAANLVAGGLIGLFAGQLLGSGLAWISILFAGAAGNLLNAWVRHAGHTSVGASTAVFAALGILAAYGWIRPPRVRHSALARFAPVVGAVVLLGFLGAGGERTDVVAHVAGFLAGLLLGALYGRLGDTLAAGKWAQVLLGAAAVGVLVLAWLAALARPGAT